MIDDEGDKLWQSFWEDEHRQRVIEQEIEDKREAFEADIKLQRLLFELGCKKQPR